MHRKGLDRRQALGAGALLTAGLGATGMTMTGMVNAQTAVADAGVVPVPMPAQVPQKEGLIEVPGGARLWYFDTGGNGTPVVFMHAGTGSGLVWGYQQPFFAKAGYRVIAYSRRGYLNSEPGSAENPGHCSEDLKILADTLGLAKFHLVGLAAGGIYSNDFAISYPERLLSLTLACTIGGVRDPDYLKVGKILYPKGFSEMSPEFKELSGSYRILDIEGTKAWVELERKSRPVTIPQRTKNTISWAHLEKFKLPVLVMTGDADLYTPPAVARMFANRIPGAEIFIVPESGHSANWERPEIFNNRLLAFLSRHKG